MQDKNLAGLIANTFSIECATNDVIFEIFRGLRTHFAAFIKQQAVKLLISSKSARPSWVSLTLSLDIMWNLTWTAKTSLSFRPPPCSSRWTRTSINFACESRNGSAGMYTFWLVPWVGQRSGWQRNIRKVCLINSKQRLHEWRKSSRDRKHRSRWRPCLESGWRLPHFYGCFCYLGQDLSEVDTQQLLELSTRAVKIIDFKREI